MRKIFVFTILIIITLYSFSSSTSFASQILENTIVETNSETSTLTVYSDCVLLVEKETGDILYEKNAYEKMYPASTTKILTAIIVLENCELNEIATVSYTALNAVPSSYTTANLQVRRKAKR